MSMMDNGRKASKQVKQHGRILLQIKWRELFGKTRKLRSLKKT